MSTTLLYVPSILRAFFLMASVTNPIFSYNLMAGTLEAKTVSSIRSNLCPSLSGVRGHKLLANAQAAITLVDAHT